MALAASKIRFDCLLTPILSSTHITNALTLAQFSQILASTQDESNQDLPGIVVIAAFMPTIS